jgi:hypothetical protein
MSKLTKTDLKTLAKYIVEENRKYDIEDSEKQLKKEFKKKQDKLDKILQDEDSKNNFIDEFLNDMMEDDDEHIDIDYMSDLNKALFCKIEGLEDIINDMNKEVKQFTEKIFDKYNKIIHSKLNN